MAPKRRLQKRAQAVGALVEASIREDGEQHRFQAAASEQLFTIDSTGGADRPPTKKQKLLLQQKDPLVKSRKFDASKASKSMLATVQKLKAQVQPVAPRAKSAADSSAVAKVWGSDGAVASPAEHALLDEYVAPAVVKKVKRRKLVAPTAHNIPKVQVAAPGQSYHPEFAAHQDVMAEAVAKELERRETLAEMSQPVGAGMSEEVLQHIDTRGSDDESEGEADADAAPARKTKAPQLVTRSQRNKRSRHKQMELEHLQRRQEKSIIKQINTANHILQDIIREEKTAEQRQELKKVLEEHKLEAEPELEDLARDAGIVLGGSYGQHADAQAQGQSAARALRQHAQAESDPGERPEEHAQAQGADHRGKERGSRVVEIRMEEYERSKRSILKKIRFRLIVLGVLMALFAIVAFTLGIRQSLGVRLRDLYFVYGAGAILFGFHGFYVDDNWARLQQDGSHLVMHVRLYSLLGLGAWLLALWLGAATLSSFGLVEVAYIAQSSPNLIYLSTLVTACLHLLVAPWLLRTIHHKGSQADEYFGAEFMADLQRPSQRVAAAATRGDSESDDEDGRREDSVDSGDDDGAGGDRGQRSRRANRQRRRGSGTRKDRAGRQKNRKAFYNADGTATVALSVPVSAASSPRSKSVALAAAPTTQASAELDGLEVTVQEGLATSSQVTDPGLIPFASPVFVIDREARLQSSDFWRLWKQLETTGSFSCNFANEPTKRGVAEHLRAFGFHVVACDARDGVLQAYFYAQQLGAADVVFLCEFVLISARRFFQATFKCQERAAAADFVARFNLQELVRVEERE
ncbi:hypothetical protein PybrP1_006530 [[Pythium] brassicae (nom. inval.)]|nr:hypothetical protein PybrP1_006530 [[Pythium] brassicae (nom. inval.)]